MISPVPPLDEVSTKDLEAAVMGGVEEPAEEPRAEAPEAAAEAPQEPEPAAEPAEPAPEAGEPAPEPPPEEFTNLQDDERIALEIRKRNPDISLESALNMAREKLGGEREPAEPEPSLDERIAEIEAKLDEAGANDGLFTAEIANLTKDHSRLVAAQAVQNARQADADDARTAEMRGEREESYQRAAESCPEALDPKSPIGAELSKVIAEAEAANNPLLYDPRAPEMFLAMANARLPESQRAELKRPAAAAQPTSDPKPAATTQAARPAPSPAGVLPVAAGRSAAQPAPATLDPANLGRAIKEMPTADLEAALLGEAAGSPVLLRL